MKRFIRVTSLAIALIFAFSTFALAAVQQGLYIGGSVDKYYSVTDFYNNSSAAISDMAKVSTSQIAYVDENGKIAKANEIYAKGGLSAALRDIVAGDLESVYTDLNGNEVKPEIPTTGELKVVSVSAISATKVEVKFNQAIDSASAQNFSIVGVTVDAATQDVNDKSIVVLTISGAVANKEYTLVAAGLKIGGEVQPDVTATFTMPEASQLYHVVVTSDKTKIKADGASRALITAKITDAEGNVLESAEDVVIEFTTTFGNIAPRVTVEKGVATTVLVSEYSETDRNAIVSAKIIEAANRDLIGIGNTLTVIISPNPEQGSTDGKPVLIDGEANQADRMTLYFDRDVDVSYFIDEEGAFKNTINFVVENKGNSLTPLTVKEVPGNSKALELILDKNDSNFPLIDNSSVNVTLQDSTGGVTQVSYASFILTDARTPEMLSVTYEDLKTLKVKFSEPVNKSSAENEANWSIDGKQLDSNNYTITVGDYNPKNGSDERNLVTIKYNKGYFKSGKHSIQAANIGDWAALSDSKNIASTQTLDFEIPEDTTKPVASVEVQSPEQFLVDFNKDVDVVTQYVYQPFELQIYDKDTNDWTVAEKVYYQVTSVDNDKFLIELTKDWTQIYDTANTNKNYYNDSYRLHIIKDTVENPANGMKNDDQYIELGGPLSAPDITSPTIDNIVDSDDGITGNSFIVTMSEPVKLPGKDDAGDTPSQKQGDSIPTPTAEFIKADKSETIPGTVDSYADKYDYELVVTPDKDLSAGDWTIVIRSISDDVGNTAASANKSFTVTPATEEQKDFYVVSAEVYGKSDNTADYINITFSKPVSVTGDYKNATKTANYLVNGKPLPVGSQILANEYDEDGNVIGVQIILPDGTLNDDNNVLNVSEYLESKDGDKIKGDLELELDYSKQ